MDYNKMAQQLGSYATDPAAMSYGVNPKTGMAKVKDPNKVGFFDRMQAGTGGAGQFLGGMFGGGMPLGNNPQAAVQWAQGLRGNMPQNIGLGQTFAPGQMFNHLPSQGQAMQAAPGQAWGTPPTPGETLGGGFNPSGDPAGMRMRLMQGFKS